MSNIITYTEQFGLKLEAAVKDIPMDPFPKQLVQWFHSHILNDIVPAYASLQKYLESGNNEDLMLLGALYERVNSWSK